MEKRVIPVTLGNDKLRSIISEIFESNNVFDNLDFAAKYEIKNLSDLLDIL